MQRYIESRVDIIGQAQRARYILHRRDFARSRVVFDVQQRKHAVANGPAKQCCTVLFQEPHLLIDK